MSTKLKRTNVNVAVNDNSNKLLTQSAIDNERAKRREASMRLDHHLKLFGSNWADVKAQPKQ